MATVSRLTADRNSFAVAICLAAMIGFMGCGSHGPKMVPIHGQVFYEGAPLSNVPQGLVRYSPKTSDSGRQASGRLQPDGTFELTTFQKGDGVVLGDYDITVTAYSSEGGPLSREQTEAGARSTGPQLMIPEKYTKPATSGLSDTVDTKHSGFKKIELTKSIGSSLEQSVYRP